MPKNVFFLNENDTVSYRTFPKKKKVKLFPRSVTYFVQFQFEYINKIVLPYVIKRMAVSAI